MATHLLELIISKTWSLYTYTQAIVSTCAVVLSNHLDHCDLDSGRCLLAVEQMVECPNKLNHTVGLEYGIKAPLVKPGLIWGAQHCETLSSSGSTICKYATVETF